MITHDALMNENTHQVVISLKQYKEIQKLASICDVSTRAIATALMYSALSGSDNEKAIKRAVKIAHNPEDYI